MIWFEENSVVPVNKDNKFCEGLTTSVIAIWLWNQNRYNVYICTNYKQNNEGPVAELL